MPPSGSDREHPLAKTSSRIRGASVSGLETQRVLSVFGANTRRGAWEPAERVEAASIFGSVTLDLREASLYDVTRIQCFCLFGNVEVLVPSDVDVDANGVGIFGGFEERHRRGGGAGVVRAIGRVLRGESRDTEPPEEPVEDPPLLEVRGFALFGSVTVKVG
jgi:hypothetical protein